MLALVFIYSHILCLQSVKAGLSLLDDFDKNQSDLVLAHMYFFPSFEPAYEIL